MGHSKDLGDKGLNLGGEEFDSSWNIWSGSITWFNMFPNEGRMYEPNVPSESLWKVPELIRHCTQEFGL